MAIGIVIAHLAVQELVACKQHRNALAKQQNRKDILCLLFSELQDAVVFGFALHTTIEAVVFIAAVQVVFAIGQIMFFVVAEQVMQRKTVMAGYEIDAADRQAVLVFVEVAAAANTGGDFR